MLMKLKYAYGVKWETLEKFGAVSEETVLEMARGIRKSPAADNWIVGEWDCRTPAEALRINRLIDWIGLSDATTEKPGIISGRVDPDRN
jgi:hypothetical protein